MTLFVDNLEDISWAVAPPPHSLAPALMQMKLKKSFGLFCSVLETPTKGENILEEINILF